MFHLNFKAETDNYFCENSRAWGLIRYGVCKKQSKTCNKVPTDVPFHLIFNKSKQINTQQNDAEDREWHPIKEIISNGKVGALRQL